MIYQRVGKNIRFLRRQKGLSQKELAAACHCSGNMISCIEKGTRHCNLKILESIADALGCSFMDLLERSEVRYSRGE